MYKYYMYMYNGINDCTCQMISFHPYNLVNPVVQVEGILQAVY